MVPQPLSGTGRTDERIVDAWRELRRADTMSAYRDVLLDGVDHAQVDALDVLVKRDGWRMSELAVALRVERSTATRAVDRLERAGLAQREVTPSARGGHTVTVRLTREGRELQAQIVRRRLQLVDRILGRFSADEAAQLATLMEKMVAGFDAHLTASNDGR
jgi:DNA-binding MarR family transcriptional regulator